MRSRRSPAFALAAILGASMALVACASGGSSTEASTTLPTLAPSFEPTTESTVAPSSTSGSTVPSTTAPPTTVAAPVWPLTGLPGANVPRAQLPALVVKIDNHPQARPQTGVNQADVVFEEIVEGITRFFTIFHSTPSDPVGPIRSARTTDINLLAQLNHPLFAWSGGNPGVTSELRSAKVATDLGASSGNNYSRAGYYRQAGRKAPHNLYTTTTNLWALAPAGGGPPPPLFSYRPAGAAPAGAQPVAGAKLSMAATKVQWLWDAASQTWQRAQDGTPDVDAAGAVIAPQNVILMFVPYGTSPADRRSPQAITVGSGEAWVLTGGGVVKGTWNRPDPSKPATFTGPNGQPILLTPGRTWVELAQTGDAVLVPAGTDPAAVPYP